MLAREMGMGIHPGVSAEQIAMGAGHLPPLTGNEDYRTVDEYEFAMTHHLLGQYFTEENYSWHKAYFRGREKVCKPGIIAQKGETREQVLASYKGTLRDTFSAAVQCEEADFWPDAEGGAVLHIVGATEVELCLPLDDVFTAFPEGVEIACVGPDCPNWFDIDAVLYEHVMRVKQVVRTSELPVFDSEEQFYRTARYQTAILNENEDGNKIKLQLQQEPYETYIGSCMFATPDLVMLYHPGLSSSTMEAWKTAFKYWSTIRVPVIITCSSGDAQDDREVFPALLEHFGFEILDYELDSPHGLPSGRNCGWILCRGKADDTEAPKPAPEPVVIEYCEGCGSKNPKKKCPCGKLFCTDACFKKSWPKHKWKWHAT